MNIYEATKIAAQEDGCITIPEYKGEVKIKPTNTRGNCVVIREDGSKRSKYGWQPSLDELLRTDWMFTE